MKSFIFISTFVFIISAHAQWSDRRGRGDWIVSHTEWTERHEAEYSAFVQALGRSKCNNVNDCIRNEANPYKGTDPEDYRFYSDCADFPYFLRAYFAWKNELPFAYMSQVRTFDDVERKNNPPVLEPGETLKPIEPRSSKLGNYPSARHALVPRGNKPLNFFNEMKRLQDRIHSGMLRIGAEVEGNVANDFYSPTIQQGSIRPGTVIYDANGHVAVVYDVLQDGRILFFDAHPDNSVTRGIFSARFARSAPSHGAGFKNFRPFRLVGARTTWAFSADYSGGRLEYARNSEIPDYSPMQYYGTNPDSSDWRKGTFVHGRSTVKFLEYVRRSLATEKINPVNEFIMSLKDLCHNFYERAQSVDAAVKKSVPNMSHPSTLPSNLFQTSGVWEDYATPGRDARLRSSFLDLKNTVNERYKEWLRNDFGGMSYSGSDLKRDFLRAFHKVNLECPISYKNSSGRTIQLGFELTIKRLFRMSFDPYHCTELRWGATHPEELKTCRDEAGKRRWYSAQQGIRNNLDRDWSSRTEITLEMLEAGEFGVSQAPEVDLRKFLESLPPKGGK